MQKEVKAIHQKWDPQQQQQQQEKEKENKNQQ